MFIPTILLALVSVVPFVAAESDSCFWDGTAPVCEGGSCPNDYYKVTVGKGGCSNGAVCATGQKSYCCRTSYRLANCEWYGTAPFCNGECPPGKVKITEDGSGDGSYCTSGCKFFCCDSNDSGSANTTAIATAATDIFRSMATNYFATQPFEKV